MHQWKLLLLCGLQCQWQYTRLLTGGYLCSEASSQRRPTHGWRSCQMSASHGQSAASAVSKEELPEAGLAAGQQAAAVGPGFMLADSCPDKVCDKVTKML